MNEPFILFMVMPALGILCWYTWKWWLKDRDEKREKCCSCGQVKLGDTMYMDYGRVRHGRLVCQPCREVIR